MEIITKEQREMIFDDLIKYYRFCKKDRRNHIFNAICALKKYGKEAVSSKEIADAKLSFQRAKESYSYYCRMKIVALLLKQNFNDFISQEEESRAIADIILHYEWRMETCSFHIQSSERALSKICQSNSIDSPEVHELEKLLSADMMEYDSYSKRMNLAKILRDEISL